MIVDRLENWRRCLSGPAWTRAFEFLLGLGPDAEEGTHELQGKDIFAPVTGYQTRYPEEALLEAHREYIDIQATLSGSERIEWFPTQGLKVKTPYDPEKDVEFFHRPHKGCVRVDMAPGMFMVLFPEDAHMPQLSVGSEPETVKKVVIKIRLGLLDV